MNELALFAGAGGGILGGKLLGWRTVCAVERDAYAASVLVARQNDGVLAPFPVWDDVCTFDGKPWKGRVDVVSGGFPCQDISSAGKGAGIDGARSGLWSHMARIIGEVRPRHVLVENSPMLTSRGLGRVLGDLASMGYDAKWGVLGAVDAGAPHKRDRIWIVADADGMRQLQLEGSERNLRGRTCNGGKKVADADLSGREEQRCAISDCAEHKAAECGGWWTAEPDVGRMAHGVAARVDRLKAIGNGQVPAVVKLAWEILGPMKKDNDLALHYWADRLEGKV
jgi:DNA (cytosine-5)-methyltransferase 1